MICIRTSLAAAVLAITSAIPAMAEIVLDLSATQLRGPYTTVETFPVTSCSAVATFW